jgi:hypothetical protein
MSLNPNDFVTWVNRGHKALKGAAITIGAASVIDLWMTVDEYNDARKAELRQERNLERQRRKDMEYRWAGLTNHHNYDGLVQKLFEQRIGHTNTWGGRRY